jgi:hypothetical protein
MISNQFQPGQILMSTLQSCPLHIRQMLYMQHTVTNLAVFARCTACLHIHFRFICSTFYNTTSEYYVFLSQYITVSFKQWCKKVNVTPRITIVILCLAALPRGDVISFLCSVCNTLYVCLQQSRLCFRPKFIAYCMTCNELGMKTQPRPLEAAV